MTTTPALPGPQYRALPRSPQTWVVQHLLPVSGLCNLYGASKGGKSWLALQLAVAVSTAEPDWLTFPVHTHGPVIYLQLDTPRSLWTDRIDSITTNGVGLDDSNVYFIDAEQAPHPFDILGTVREPLSPAWDYLHAQVATVKPTLVVIDTLREVHTGDENDSAQMRNVMAALSSATHPAALVLLSHSRKSNLNIPEAEREQLLDDNRGSNYIAGRMDGIVRATSTPRTCRLTYQSRTIDRHILKCKRIPPGLWTVDASEEEATIRAVLADPTLATLSARAEVLSGRIGRSVEACRSLLRRRGESQQGVTAAPVAEINT